MKKKETKKKLAKSSTASTKKKVKKKAVKKKVSKKKPSRSLASTSTSAKASKKTKSLSPKKTGTRKSLPSPSLAGSRASTSKKSESALTPEVLNSKDLRERLFVLEYLSDAKLNGTQAAIRAGYTENPRSAAVLASKLLTKDNIREMIDAHIVDREVRLKIKQENVLIRLHEIREAKLTDYITWGHEIHEEERVIDSSFDATTKEGLQLVKDAEKGKDGQIALIVTHRNTVLFKNSEELSDAQARAINEISVGKDGQMKIKLEQKTPVNKLIGDHLGMFEKNATDKDEEFRTSFQRMLDEIREEAPKLPFKEGI